MKMQCNCRCFNPSFGLLIRQGNPQEHTAAHAKMLAFGIKTKNTREIVGQLPRLLVGGIKSWAGIIPVGNTGGANVSATRPMPIPADLQAVLDAAEIV